MGRLEAHKSPIVALDIVQEKPFVFTMDNTNEIIIWDIRSYTPLQII